MSNTNLNHKCKICGALYESCDGCSHIKNSTPWRALCDTSQHYQVYMIITSLRDGVMNETEVRDSLKQIGVTVDDIRTFIPVAQEILLPIVEEKNVDVDDVVEEIVKVESELKFKKK